VIRDTHLYIVYREGIANRTRWRDEVGSVYPYNETTRLARHFTATGCWSRWAIGEGGVEGRGAYI